VTSDSDIIAARVERAPPAGEIAAPGESLYRRLEPTILGAGGIVVLLLLWELLPYLVTVSAGTKLFFTTPSAIAATLWKMFANGTIWTPLAVSASGFARARPRHPGRIAARCADRPLAHSQCHDRPFHHRL
jgi:hypothetical protein